ncbi:hypothetical protein Y1Q_0022344 [Alligator mississippiensis]|uniref:Uncharacterized protein n=1 Tax=Alligator mississippiensis TaxID=8496 RepID=A0A151NDP9_ALLMI|nr:hypothetical protein Y1Q_0022344 [Alligator mississippiensis]
MKARLTDLCGFQLHRRSCCRGLNEEEKLLFDALERLERTTKMLKEKMVALAVILGILVFVIVLGGFCLWRLLCAKGALQSELEREKKRHLVGKGTLQSKTESGKAALQSELEIEKERECMGVQKEAGLRYTSLQLKALAQPITNFM